MSVKISTTKPIYLYIYIIKLKFEKKCRPEWLQIYNLKKKKH